MAWFNPTESVFTTTTTKSSGGTLTLKNLERAFKTALSTDTSAGKYASFFGNAVGRSHTFHQGKIKNAEKYQEYLRGFKDFEFFRGGDEKGRERINKLLVEWKELAFKKGIIKEDLLVEFEGKDYLDKAFTMKIRSFNNFPEGLTFDEVARYIVEDAAREASRGERGLATIEGEILKEGALIYGEISGKDNRLLVYYPTKEQVVMDKLLGKDLKRSETVTSTSWGPSTSVSTSSIAGGVLSPSVSPSPSVSFSLSSSPSPSPSPAPNI